VLRAAYRVPVASALQPVSTQPLIPAYLSGVVKTPMSSSIPLSASSACVPGWPSTQAGSQAATGCESGAIEKNTRVRFPLSPIWPA
jgi:hypothetical protein